MKLHIFSDNHFDASSGGWEPKLAPGADVVVCAGDVCQGLPEAFRFLRTFIPGPTPIVTVAGNHSFYGRELRDEMQKGREAAARYGVTFLENQTAVIGGVRFVGSTLWTDYALYGDPRGSAAAAAREMNDHQMITIARRGGRLTGFAPEDANALFQKAVGAISVLLAEPFDGPTAVVTHHAPSLRSIAAKYAGDRINPAFASDIEWLIGRLQPDLWIHGHTHSSFDYRIGRTRIVCNPHGYGRENVSGFDPECVIELVTPAPEAPATARMKER